jgi:hypothetical protein
VRLKLDAEGLGHLFIAGGRVQADGQHHHIELFLFYPLIWSGILYSYILGLGYLPAYRYVAPDKTYVRQLFGPLVEPLEVLAEGTDIVVEYGALGIGVMVFGQNYLFLGIGAAYRRAVAVAAGDDLPGTDALNPGS